MIVTGTVTGWPAASLVLRAVRQPGERSRSTLLNWMLPVNGCEISSPTTGSAKSTISVQVPGDRVDGVRRQRRALRAVDACSARSRATLPSGLTGRRPPDRSASLVSDTFGGDVVHAGADVELVVVHLALAVAAGRCRRSAVPLNAPPWADVDQAAQRHRDRGLVPPTLESSTIDPAASPGEDGVFACTLTVLALARAPASASAGETEPNERELLGRDPPRTVPLVPLSAATSCRR